MKSSTPDAVKKPEPLKLLLMAPPGNRKTWLLLQFPDLHVEDCDQNLDGAEKVIRFGITDLATGKLILPPLNPNLSYTYDTIRKDDDDNPVEIEDCYDRLCDMLKKVKLDEQLKKRRTYGVDSLSHVNEFIIRKILKLKSKPSMEINLWTDFASNAYSLLVARLDTLTSMGKAVVCTCHEEKITEAEAGNIMKKRTTEINPLFSGRVGDSIGAFFTDVWKLEKRQGQANTTELWLLSDRTPKCEHLKNSVGLPSEINITKGFSVIEPYLKNRI